MENFTEHYDVSAVIFVLQRKVKERLLPFQTLGGWRSYPLCNQAVAVINKDSPNSYVSHGPQMMTVSTGNQYHWCAYHIVNVLKINRFVNMRAWWHFALVATCINCLRLCAKTKKWTKWATFCLSTTVLRGIGIGRGGHMPVKKRLGGLKVHFVMWSKQNCVWRLWAPK